MAGKSGMNGDVQHWEVRYAIVEGLYPGECQRLLVANRRLVNAVVRDNLSAWSSRFGRDEVMSDALLGALKGIVDWLWQPEDNRAAISTYIYRQIVWHFGAHVPRWIGPIRIPRGSEREDGPTSGQLGDYLTEANDTIDQVDLREFSDQALSMLDQIDAASPGAIPAGQVARLVFGSGMTYEEAAVVLGASRQGCHQRLAAAVKAVRLLMNGDGL